MSSKCKTSHCNCCEGREHMRVESLMLDDGRRAERHITLNEDGNEVVEIFAEEKRPLKLEKRIVRETKQIVAKEIHETVRDGEVVHQEIHSLEPDVPLQVRQKIGVVDHAKVVDGDYVRKDEIGKLIEDSVVAGVSTGISALMAHHSDSLIVPKSEQIFSSQSIVEKNVDEKKKKNVALIFILGAVFAAQVAFSVWYVLAS